MNQEEKFKKNALTIVDLLFPFIRFVVSFVFIVHIIHRVFFLDDSILQVEHVGIILISLSLIIFHVTEAVQELKSKFLKANYFRISSIFIEIVIIGKMSFSIFLLLKVIDKDNFLWLNIVQQSVFILLILFLLIKDISRIWEEH